MVAGRRASRHNPELNEWTRVFPSKVLYSAAGPTSDQPELLWRGEYKLEPTEPLSKKLSRLIWRKHDPGTHCES